MGFCFTYELFSWWVSRIEAYLKALGNLGTKILGGCLARNAGVDRISLCLGDGDSEWLEGALYFVYDDGRSIIFPLPCV
jgi:hypothetical protein